MPKVANLEASIFLIAQIGSKSRAASPSIFNAIHFFMPSFLPNQVGNLGHKSRENIG